MKEMLKNTIEETVIEAMQEVDIRAIIKAQVEHTTKRIANDIFGEYGDFKKEMQEHLKNTLTFNISKLSVPDFSAFAIETVRAELVKIQHEEKERIERKVLKNINELLGTHREPITLVELQDTFALEMYENFIKDKIHDGCQCEDYYEPENLYDVNDASEFLPCMFELKISEREWGTYGRYCTTHLLLSFKEERGDKGGGIDISVHISRQHENNETDGDFYKKSAKNLYKILGVTVDGKDIKQDGLLLLQNIKSETVQAIVSRFINGAFIDATDIGAFELEEV